METLNAMAEFGHEQVAMYHDPETGLRGIIAIHDTTLGPSCGGTRMWPYATEADALADALQLSRAMTYKSAAAGLNLGGGKGVIIGDSRTQKTEALMRSWGRFVDTLGGRYLTTTDVGTTGRDLEFIHQETKHVVGLDVSLGGSGDTSIMTGLGIYMGMKACANDVWNSDSLRGRTVAMQGFGKVASHTAEHLLEEDARVIATDISETALDRARSMGIRVVGVDDIYGLDCDIFAPCALGGVINQKTAGNLRCRIVARRRQQPAGHPGGRRNPAPTGHHVRSRFFDQRRRCYQRVQRNRPTLQPGPGATANRAHLREDVRSAHHIPQEGDVHRPGRRSARGGQAGLGAKGSQNLPTLTGATTPFTKKLSQNSLSPCGRGLG